LNTITPLFKTDASDFYEIIGFIGEKNMDWRERISVNPAVCYGKACVRESAGGIFKAVQNGNANGGYV